MKILFISDIHGMKTNLPKIREKFLEYDCDKLVVLGDLYCTGYENKMIEEYDDEYVKNFLESFNNKLIFIKGNCDSKIDVNTSNFPIFNELGMISTINNDLYLTHGHIYNHNNWNKINSYLIFGHFHIPFITEVESNTYICTGSISLPRAGYEPSYLFYNEDEFIIFDIKDKIIARKVLNK